MKDQYSPPLSTNHTYRNTLNIIHYFCICFSYQSNPCELRIDLKWPPLDSVQPLKAVPYSESSLESAFAQYKTFSLTGFTDNYRINVAGYTGTWRDDLNVSNGDIFTVQRWEFGLGGWWFSRSTGRQGPYKHLETLNLNWFDAGWFQVSEMKVRPHA